MQTVQQDRKSIKGLSSIYIEAQIGLQLVKLMIQFLYFYSRYTLRKHHPEVNDRRLCRIHIINYLSSNKSLLPDDRAGLASIVYPVIPLR